MLASVLAVRAVPGQVQVGELLQQFHLTQLLLVELRILLVRYFLLSFPFPPFPPFLPFSVSSGSGSN